MRRRIPVFSRGSRAVARTRSRKSLINVFRPGIWKTFISNCCSGACVKHRTIDQAFDTNASTIRGFTDRPRRAGTIVLRKRLRVGLELATSEFRWMDELRLVLGTGRHGGRPSMLRRELREEICQLRTDNSKRKLIEGALLRFGDNRGARIGIFQ